MSGILHLTLKRKWFEMIRSGEKKEEYREIKSYWDARLNREFQYVKFKNGYGENAPCMIFRCDGITKGVGKKKWGAPDNEVYIISLGERL